MLRTFSGLHALAALAVMSAEPAVGPPAASDASPAQPPTEPPPAAPPAVEPETDTKAAKRVVMAWVQAGHALKLNTLIRVPADLAVALRAAGRARDADKEEIKAAKGSFQDLDAV